MSTGNASSPSVTPSTVTSINSLPLEIKALIVKLARNQDYNFIRRASCEEKEDMLCGDLLMSNRWRGKSVKALFSLNKEWSDLAAVHLFKVLRVHKMGSRIFKCYILCKRAHLFQEVRFGMTDPATIQAAFTALPLLPNVKSLYLELNAIETFFGESEFGPSGNNDFDDSFQYFRAFGKQVTRLQIDILTPPSLGILSAFLELKHLEVESISLELDVAEQKSIGNAFAALALESLTLCDGFFDQTLKYIFESHWRSFNTLRSLKINCSHFEVAHMEFIQHFSNSLERLAISPGTIQEDIFAFKPTLPLIRLQHLSIIGGSHCFPALLQLFSTSPITTLYLQECNFDASSSIALLISTPLVELINKSLFLKLKQIKINGQYAPSSQYSTLIQLCKSKNIVLHFSTWFQQYLLQERRHPSSETLITSAIPHLKDALDFGNRRLVELEKDEDVEGMKEMFENCRWLRAHAALEKD